MNIESKEENGITIITIQDPRVDAVVSPELKAFIMNLVEQGASTILLDLSKVDFMDSSGLSVVVASLKTIGSNGTLALCSLQGAVADLFKISRMERVFKLYPSQEDAVSALAI